METKRLIVSTNYINLHARKRERESMIERERVRVLAKERMIKMKKEGTGSGVYNNNTAKSLPLFYFFYYANVKKNVNCRIKEIIKCMKTAQRCNGHI